LGCLALLMASDLPAPIFEAREAQTKLGERATHASWLTGATLSDPLRGFPARAAVRLQPGQTLHKPALRRALPQTPAA